MMFLEKALSYDYNTAPEQVQMLLVNDRAWIAEEIITTFYLASMIAMNIIYVLKKLLFS